jgi:hypothetical protein
LLTIFLQEGIPYTAKDSYSVKGMSLACGSPAFVDLVASQDAFVIQEIRRAGGVLLGRTNMPPMAAGASSIIPHLRISSNGRVCNVAFMGAPSLHTLPITYESARPASDAADDRLQLLPLVLGLPTGLVLPQPPR